MRTHLPHDTTTIRPKVSFADILIARRRADDALIAELLPDRISFLVGMSILVAKPRFKRDARFDEQFGFENRPYEWIVGTAFLRTDANVSREVLADKLLRSINGDGGAEALHIAVTAQHYRNEAELAA